MGPGETPGGAKMQEEDLAQSPNGSPFSAWVEGAASKGVWLPGRKILRPGHRTRKIRAAVR